MQLQGKVAIVTGGVSGIGAGCTRLFTARGAKVVAVDLNEEQAALLAEELGDDLHVIIGDVSDRTVAQQAVAAAVERFGSLTTVVNNAHASAQAPFVELTDDQWDLSFRTGLNATRHFMTAAYPELRKHGGSVINFGSGAGLEGQQTQAAYASAKEAIRGLSRVAANEWASEKIRVNVVCPVALTGGIIAWKEEHPKMFEAVVKKIPLGYLGDPESDIAPIVAFLASDDSRYMTGQTLMADGGGIKLR